MDEGAQAFTRQKIFAEAACGLGTLRALVGCRCYSSNKYVWGTYYVANTILGTGHVGEQDKVPLEVATSQGWQRGMEGAS